VFETGFLQYIRILNGRKTVKYSEMRMIFGGRGVQKFNILSVLRLTCMKTNTMANVSLMKTGWLCDWITTMD
jgi:hypothetical protein